jgi:glucose/arabinose dehydrogenase
MQLPPSADMLSAPFRPRVPFRATPIAWHGRTAVASAVAIAAVALLAGCGDVARLTVEQGTGPNPQLTSPRSQWLPTLKVAKASGWPGGEQPRPAPGLRVQAFATGMDHPRWLYTLPNGDVLVAESNAPQKDRHDDGGGLREWAMKLVMQRAGAGVPSPDRIVLLRDTNGDGVADQRSVLLQDLHSPFGMALVGDMLYIANTDAVVRVPYRSGQTHIDAKPVVVTPLPALPKNHHWTKNILADASGQRLYVTVGSNSNVAEDGLDIEERRAAIHEIDLATGQTRLYATGLRNPNGLAWVPAGAGNAPVLWTVVNERDEIGSDLVPDYMTAVRDGGFYGWPYSYWGQHVDTRVAPQRSDLVARAITPDYALGPHTASLGLHWLDRGAMAQKLGNGMVIGQHGSWNRKPASGYRVVFVSFVDGKPSGMPLTLLDGFLSASGDEAYGRPVGVTQDARGALLVADDVGNAVWRVSVDDPTVAIRP